MAGIARQRNVLLVEDIVDSGHTIASVLGMLETRNRRLEEIAR